MGGKKKEEKSRLPGIGESGLISFENRCLKMYFYRARQSSGWFYAVRRSRVYRTKYWR